MNLLELDSTWCVPCLRLKKRFASPHLLCLLFSVSCFICFYPPPPKKKPSPCPPLWVGVAEGTGLSEYLKSHRGYLIRNSKDSSTYLGQACWHCMALVCLCWGTGEGNEGRVRGRGERRQRMLQQQLKGRVSYLSSLLRHLVVCPSSALYFIHLSRYIAVSSSDFACWSQQLWEEKESKMSSHCSICTPTSMTVS